MLAVVALLVLAVSTPAFSYTENPLFHAFLQWSSKHGKVYAAEEVNNRFTNWQNSLEVCTRSPNFCELPKDHQQEQRRSSEYWQRCFICP